jgi:hypothetical protein
MEQSDQEMRKGMIIVFGGIVVLFTTILVLANYLA